MTVSKDAFEMLSQSVRDLTKEVDGLRSDVHSWRQGQTTTIAEMSRDVDRLGQHVDAIGDAAKANAAAVREFQEVQKRVGWGIKAAGYIGGTLMLVTSQKETIKRWWGAIMQAVGW